MLDNMKSLLENHNKHEYKTSYDINGEAILPYWYEWSFVDRFINNIDTIYDIDIHISEWNELKDEGEELPELHEFLGLSLEDYTRYSKDNNTLLGLLEKYKYVDSFK